VDQADRAQHCRTAKSRSRAPETSGEHSASRRADNSRLCRSRATHEARLLFFRVQGSLFGLKLIDGHCNQSQGEAIIDDFLLMSVVLYRSV
jgi:hypothetical protein